MRVNTLKIKLEDALAHFRARKWTVETPDQASFPEGEGGCRLTPARGTIIVDPLVPNLLVFPPGTSLHGDSMVADGSLILQVSPSLNPQPLPSKPRFRTESMYVRL